jgi:hypothetical protein
LEGKAGWILAGERSRIARGRILENAVWSVGEDSMPASVLGSWWIFLEANIDAPRIHGER